MMNGESLTQPPPPPAVLAIRKKKSSGPHKIFHFHSSSSDTPFFHTSLQSLVVYPCSNIYIFIHSAIQAFIVSPQCSTEQQHLTKRQQSVPFDSMCAENIPWLCLFPFLFDFFFHTYRDFFSFTFSAAAALVAHFHGPKKKRV